MIYIRSGSQGETVKAWQIAMNLASNKTRITKLVADGIFGPKTLKATIDTQRYIGTKPDGLVGPKTVAAFRAKFPAIPLNIDAGVMSSRTVNTSGIFKQDSMNTITSESGVQPKKKMGMLPWVLGAVGIAFFLRRKKKK